VVGAEAERWDLFLKGRGQLLAYVRRLAPTGCECSDVVQEVGLRLLRRPDAVTHAQRLGAWCRAVARHIVLHELRSARIEREKLSVLRFGRGDCPWESERHATNRTTVARELAGMDEPSRELLLRRYVLEQTSDEIAREMNLSGAAVRMRLMRVRSARANGSDS
jgi:RNA polymerase sigma factor (sigma-70 family)